VGNFDIILVERTMKARNVFASLLLAVGACSTLAMADQPAVDPKADAILKQMSQTLGASKSFTFDVHAEFDQILPNEQKVQFAKNQKVTLRRPDKLAADVVSDADELKFRYDGKQVVLFNAQTKSWGAAAAPSTIEQTLDLLAQKYGMVIPLADLAFDDPYKCMTEHVKAGLYLGAGYVFDEKCEHLAFQQESVDWQIWISQGEKPLPKKFVITFKQVLGSPQYTAYLNDWNLAANAGDDRFTFEAPAGSKQVEFAPATQPSASAR